MASSELLNVHPALFDRVRLAIMAHLSLTKSPVDFNTLLTELDLEDDGLVNIKKAFIGRKTRTTYSCTSKGKKAVQVYLSAVETVLRSSL